MPGKVKVKVLAGRHLPVMDRSNDTTDAFVEVKLGGTTCKTDVCRKSLNPQWNSEWFKFEMDDLELQDEPLQIRLMDYDTYSANDAIGKVYIDLNPLLTNPSKTKEPSGRAMSGWIPVYDTMHGIRGEVNLMVKVELFSDLNKFRQSSCGVKFFFTQAIPDGHVAIQLHGFVEELVVNDDPEYQWIDKIRTPRASNEARQLLFLKLAGEVQRRVGLKALELGGNAVIGYRVCFDLEGELGIVVRGIGTAATLAKTVVEPIAENPKETRDAVVSSGSVVPEGSTPPADSNVPKNTPEKVSAVAGDSSTSASATDPTAEAKISEAAPATNTQNPATIPEAPSSEPHGKKIMDQKEETGGGTRKREVDSKKGSAAQLSFSKASSSASVHARNGSAGTSALQHRVQGAHFNKATGMVNVMPPQPGSSAANCRRSSDSELSTPPTGAMNSSIEAIISHNKSISFAKRLASGTDHFDLLEYPFVTIGQLPPRFVQHIGGAVSARSVKLLERISNLEEPETRDSWWTEIRLEIRSHTRSLCCNVILGYEEQTTICDDVCILSATGTAALVNSSALHDMADKGVEVLAKSDKDRPQTQNEATSNGLNGPTTNAKARHGSAEDPDCSCSVFHIPYSEAFLPFPVKMVRCQICKKDKVPDLLLATIGFPSNLPICGKTSLIQAHVFRPKKDCKGESSAKEVSDSVPFLEYELHRRLINKLKMKGMNAIFCLQVQICLGETLMIGVATGTSVCLAGLPPPSVPKITGGNLKTDTQKVAQFQRVIQDTYDRNREYYMITTGPFGHYQVIPTNGYQPDDDEDAIEEVPNVDLATGNKDSYVLEVDDAEDIDIISELVDPSPPTACEMSNLDTVVGYDDYRVVSQQVFAQIWRCHVPNMTLRRLAGHFDRLLRAIGFKLRAMKPCVINKLRFRVELPEPDEIQISIIGTALGLAGKIKQEVIPTSVTNSRKSIEDGDMIFQLDCDGGSNKQEEVKKTNDVSSQDISKPTLVKVRASVTDTSDLMSVQEAVGPPGLAKTPTEIAGGVQTISPTIPIPGTDAPPHGSSSSRTPTFPSFLTPRTASSPHVLISHLPQISRSLLVPSLTRTITKPLLSAKGKYVIEVTTLSCIPGYRVEKYLGNLNCFFIRESTSIKEVGGPSGFVHNFIVEVLAIIRAHVAALGGNALVSYFMTELSILHNPHKNQGQCLINVGGDVVNILPASGLEDEKRMDDM